MKNPFPKMSPRDIRIIFSAVSIFVFVATTIHILQVMIFRVTTNDQCAWIPLGTVENRLLIEGVVPDGVTAKAGVQNGDTLLRIDGKSFTTRFEAQRVIDSIKAGDFAMYEVKRGNNILTARVQMLKIFDVRSLSLYLLGLGFLLVGYVVVMSRPQGVIQRMFGRYGILAMLLFGFFFGGADTRDPSWVKNLTFGLLIAARILAPAVFVTFFFYFPVRKKILQRKWIKPAIYLFSISCLLPLLKADVTSLPATVLVFLANFPIFFFGAGLAIFIHSYFTQVDKARRQPLRPILYAVGLGIVVILYVTIVNAVNPFIIYLNPIAITPALLLVFVPQAFGYAIFRYRLMDIDLLIKRSLIYGMITAIVAAIYVLIIYGVGNMIAYLVGTEDNRILNVVAFVVIALAFDPIKRRMQEWIDRVFYQERYNYQKALLEFSQELPRQMNFEQILNSIIHRISTTMHVEKVAVVLEDGHSETFCVTQNVPQHLCHFCESESGLISLLKSSRVPQSFGLLAEEPESSPLDQDDKQKIIESGIVLAVPMMLQDRFIGAINVGPKLSGKVYSQEDTDLLSTVASQAAIAIENARLHKSEIEKQKYEEELALARRIQQGLLPKSNPVIQGLDIAGISIPALTVGGDYFDYIQIDPRKLLVVVADVSGKGMPASLYMSKVQGMVQLAAQMYSSPHDILVQVNRRLYDGMERKSFITMIVALFDLDKREVQLCRAGHHKALIQTNGDIRYLDARGIGLGLERGPLFESELEEIRRPLTPGGTYLFYSDGLPEAMNEQHDEFGDTPVCELVKNARKHSANELQASIVAAVRKFQGTAEQHDDLTIVVVKTA